MRAAWAWAVMWTVLLATLITLPLLAQEGTKSIGYVVVSDGASLNGVSIPNNIPILDGDLLMTGPQGHAVARFQPTMQVTLSRNTSVRFHKTQAGISADLSSGTLEVGGIAGVGVVVNASTFEVTAGGAGERKFYVALMSDKSVYVEAMEGDVRITEALSGRWYILPGGATR